MSRGDLRLPAGRSRPAFVFAADRCTGCEACRVACGNENGGGQDLGWRTISTLNPGHHPELPTQHLSLACNHCDVPACALGCPAAAYHRDERTGAVLLSPEKCIGCRYCSWVCPYDAPQFDAARGTMAKCTFCAHRVAAGDEPACTAACPTGALGFGLRPAAEAGGRVAGAAVVGPSATPGRGVSAEGAPGTPAARARETSEVAVAAVIGAGAHAGDAAPSVLVGLGEHGLGPALVVIPPRSRRGFSAQCLPPASDLALATPGAAAARAPAGLPPALAIDALLAAAGESPRPSRVGKVPRSSPPSTPVQPRPARKITPRSEWTLLVFSLLLPALVGWFAGGVWRAERAPSALVLLGLGGLAMALATAHLGRPLRAWRAVLNWRTSWLSREVLAANAFLLTATSFLLLPHADWQLAIPGLLSGAALCVAIDGVYRAIPRREVGGGAMGPGVIWHRVMGHSGEAVPSAVFLAAVVAGVGWLATVPAVWVAMLFGRRWRASALGIPAAAAYVRLGALAGAALLTVGVDAAAPAVAATTPVPPWMIAALLALVGIALDRYAFYGELEPTSPRWRLADAVARGSAKRSPG